MTDFKIMYHLKILSTSFLFLFTVSLSVAQSWDWVKPLSFNSSERPFDIATDPWGSCYSISSFIDTIDAGGNLFFSPDEWSSILIKWDSSGNFLWAKQMENGNNQGATVKHVPSIATDRIGNIYVLSMFTDSLVIDGMNLVSYYDSCIVCPCWIPNEPMCLCPMDTVICFARDMFIAKFSPTGDLLLLKQVSSPYDKFGMNIEIDDNFSIYLTGKFTNTIFFDTIILTAIDTISGGDIFVAKLDYAGNVLWASSGGGVQINSDVGFSIAAYKNEYVYITGSCWSNSIFGAIQVADPGAFVAKYDKSGTCVWAKNINFNGKGFGIDVDNYGNCYVGGEYNDLFIAKLDSNGNLLWKKTADGLYFNTVFDLKADEDGNCFATGYFKGQIIFDSITLTPATSDGIDLFVLSYDTYGNLDWIIQDGGPKIEEGQSMAIGYHNDIFLTGFFPDTSTIGNNPLFASGWIDVYVAKISAPVQLTPDTIVSGSDFFPIPSCLKIIPNPVTGWAVIQHPPVPATGSSSIIISGVAGFVHKKYNLKMGGDHLFINNRDFATGIYLVAFYHGDALKRWDKIIVMPGPN